MEQNGLEYEETNRLMSIQSRKEDCKYVSFIHGRIKQEEVIEYKVNYCEVNYEYEHVKEIDYVKTRPCLNDYEYFVCVIIKNYIAEFCEIIEGKKVEIIIEEDIVCEIIDDKNVEIIEDQKVEDINMLKSSIISFDAIRRLDLKENELRVIAMLRIVKNYENLSKSSLIKEINKIKLSEEQKRLNLKAIQKMILEKRY